ncbi:MAG: 50S ribosomal protein L11 methyltransferase [Cyanobacteria bacterium P01_F01_bin.3]
MSLQNSHTPEKWWEVIVSCPPTLEDSVYWAFDELGSKGTASQIKDARRVVTAYFPQVQFQPSDFEGLRSTLLNSAANQADTLITSAVRQAGGITTLPSVDISWQLIDEEDWAKSWKTHWRAEEIGDRLLINPAWMEAPETARTVLTLDPGSAFGTGAHATTQLCLEALEKQSLSGTTIADIGCGSGILSIAALLYGAKRVLAADVDPLAVSSSQSNAELNGIEASTQPNAAQLAVQLGSLPEIITMAEATNVLPVDGIVCNILSEIIVGLIIPRLSELAGPATWGILSGILTSKAPWVEEHLTAYGWQVTGITHQDEWCAMNIALADTASA